MRTERYRLMALDGRNELLSAAWTFPRWNGHFAALVGAISLNTCFFAPPVKTSAASGTPMGTAYVAEFRVVCSRDKNLVAPFTFEPGGAIGKSGRGNQVGVVLPEFSLRDTVTRSAEGDEVFQAIRFQVCVKENKRGFMVNVQLAESPTTMLASVVISEQGLFSYLIPVRASVAGMTTPPRGMVRAGQKLANPLASAGATAKIPVSGRTGVDGLCLPAQGTSDLNPRNRWSAGAIFMLPVTVALETAKRSTLGGLVFEIGFAEKHFPTLPAGERHLFGLSPAPTLTATIFGRV